MLQAMNPASEKSITEAEEEKGFGFILGEVRQWKPFKESFDKLVSKGCFPIFFFGAFISSCGPNFDKGSGSGGTPENNS